MYETYVGSDLNDPSAPGVFSPVVHRLDTPLLESVSTVIRRTGLQQIRLSTCHKQKSSKTGFVASKLINNVERLFK